MGHVVGLEQFGDHGLPGNGGEIALLDRLGTQSGNEVVDLCRIARPHPTNVDRGLIPQSVRSFGAGREGNGRDPR